MYPFFLYEPDVKSIQFHNCVFLFIPPQQTEVYIKKLELKVSGFIDLSGLVATFAVLVLLLSQPNRNEYFLPVLAFVFLSMIMQCVLAVILIIRVRMIIGQIVGSYGNPAVVSSVCDPLPH